MDHYHRTVPDRINYSNPLFRGLPYSALKMWSLMRRMFTLNHKYIYSRLRKTCDRATRVVSQIGNYSTFKCPYLSQQGCWAPRQWTVLCVPLLVGRVASWHQASAATCPGRTSVFPCPHTCGWHSPLCIPVNVKHGRSEYITIYYYILLLYILL